MRHRSSLTRLLAVVASLVVLSTLGIATATAESPDAVEARNLATVRSSFEAWANGTGSPYDSLAEDATWEIVGNSAVSRVYTSKADFITNVIQPFNARMSQRLIPTIRDTYADGDTVIVYFDAAGIGRDGVPYSNTYAWFLALRDDQIVKASAFFDSIAFDDFWERVSPAS